MLKTPSLPTNDALRVVLKRLRTQVNVESPGFLVGIPLGQKQASSTLLQGLQLNVSRMLHGSFLHVDQALRPRHPQRFPRPNYRNLVHARSNQAKRDFGFLVISISDSSPNSTALFAVADEKRTNKLLWRKSDLS